MMARRRISRKLVVFFAGLEHGHDGQAKESLGNLVFRRRPGQDCECVIESEAAMPESGGNRSQENRESGEPRVRRTQSQEKLP